MKNEFPILVRLRLLFGVVLTIILFLGNTSLTAQFTPPIIQKLADPLNKLGKKFQVVINPMVEDTLGYIWVGTKNGLCKYSGSSILCYQHQAQDSSSISGNNIENIFIDHRQHIWVAIQSKGLNIFNINGKKIKSFKYEPNNPKGILSNRVWGIFEDEDAYIWVSYFSGGLSRYDTKKDQFDHFSIDSPEFLVKYRPKTVIKSIKHDTEAHTYWLSTTRGLVKFNSRTQAYSSYLFYSHPKKKVYSSNYNRSKLESLWNRCMIKDSEGILWLGNFGGLVRFDPKKESYQVFFDESQPIIKNVVGIYDYDDEYILLSQHTGLVLFSKKDYSYTDLTQLPNIGDHYDLNTRFYTSKNGCTYMINANGDKTGIYQFCDHYNGLRDVVTGSYPGDILATDHYLHYYEKQAKITSVHLSSGNKSTYSFKPKSSSSIQSMTNIGGDSILFADFHHLYQYHPDNAPNRVKELDIENAYRYESLLKDAKKNIWSGRQRDGIYKYDVRQDSIVHFNQSSNPSLVYQDYIVDMMEDQNHDIWIATEQGWSIYYPSSHTTQHFHANDIAQQYGIDLKAIVKFEQTKDGTIWIATAANGLIKWDKQRAKVISIYTINNGLRNPEIYDLCLDQADNLWIATSGSLAYLDHNMEKLLNFGIEYGISKQIYDMTLDKNGILYAAHSNGYYIIDTKEFLNKKGSTTIPVLNNFRLLGAVSDSLLKPNGNIQLSYQQNFFSFEFGSKNYFNPELEQYQYQLKPLDKNWINAKGKREKDYTALPPGEYAFHLRVRTEDGWSPSVVQNLKISPPWYNTWHFLCLTGLLLALIFYSLMRFYINYQKRNLENDKRFAELETMILKAQMNPHFIFNSLNSIRYLFMKDEKDKGLKYITKFARLLRSTLHHGDQALIHLVDEIELTELYISLEQLRFEDKFTFTHSYPEDGKWRDILIPPFVIQPIVENAFWHGLSPSKKEEKILDITIQNQNNIYMISIRDNGVGLSNPSPNDPNVNKKKSYGLQLIKERFELINKTQENNYTLEIREPDDKNGLELRIKIRLK